MSRRRHARLFAMATISWAAFWALGLPSYDQQYSPAFMACFDAVLLVAIVPAVFLVLRRVPGRRPAAPQTIPR